MGLPCGCLNEPGGELRVDRLRRLQQALQQLRAVKLFRDVRQLGTDGSALRADFVAVAAGDAAGVEEQVAASGCIA